MKTVVLRKVKHGFKFGDRPVERPANLSEDSLFVNEEGRPVGFFVLKPPDTLAKLMNVAEHEIHSDRVPKQRMDRKRGVNGEKNRNGTYKYEIVTQWSVTCGSVAPNARMRRPYPNKSALYNVPTAKRFRAAMLRAAQESGQLIEAVSPELFRQHTKAMEPIPEKWRFGQHFTSSISNYNIAAPIHIDKLNVRGALNVIICKRRNSRGGNLFVPDYDVTFAQADGSILVYPAWANLHGVTPIIPTEDGGYRNSHVFYSVTGFQDYP